MYIQETKGRLRFIDTDSDIIIKHLDNKLYEIEVKEDMWGNKFYFFNENTAYEKGKVAGAGVFKNLREYIQNYFSKEGQEVRDAMSLSTRLGLLFQGEPGTGKTFLAGQIARMLREEKNAVAITSTTPSQLDLGKVVDMARKDDPDRLVVMIWDEFEKDFQRASQRRRDELLAFLDGVNSRDNIVVIATCNSLDVFPPTFLDRPGRFERVAEFKISDEVVLKNIVNGMIPEKYKNRIEESKLFEAAKNMPKVSIDKIKSLVRDSLVNILKGKKDYIPKDEDRAKTEKPKRPRGEEFKKLLKKKMKVEDIHEYFYQEDLETDDYVTAEDLLFSSKN